MGVSLPAVKSTRLKLRCFSDYIVWVQIPVMALASLRKNTFTIITLSFGQNIMEEQGLTEVFLVLEASTLVYRLPHACRLQ